MEHRLFLKLFSLIVLAFLCSHCGTSPSRSYPPVPISASSPFDRDPSGRIVHQPRSIKFLMWPVARHKVSQSFRSEETSHKRAHDGIDISSPNGARIYAPADGTVIYAGHRFHGYGKMIMIEHSPIFTTLYGHCQKLLVHSGEAVKRGNLIALVGHTGHAKGPHLHFEVRVKREPVDPLIYLED